MGAANKLGPLGQDFGRSCGKRHFPARGKIVDDPLVALVESPQRAKQVGRMFRQQAVDPEGRPVSFARGTFSGLRVELIIEP